MKKHSPIEEESEIPLKKEMNMIGMIQSDPMGSYTGLPLENWGSPVQDADDL